MFCAQGGRFPVSFTAAKSALGHAEAGAGVLGMLHAVTRLQQDNSRALTHLRALNPHVAGILEAGHCAASLPKQDAPGLSGGDAHIGVSSFAFQVAQFSWVQT
jgi:acyl transferase domain-containing protein